MGEIVNSVLFTRRHYLVQKNNRVHYLLILERIIASKKRFGAELGL